LSLAADASVALVDLHFHLMIFMWVILQLRKLILSFFQEFNNLVL